MKVRTDRVQKTKRARKTVYAPLEDRSSFRRRVALPRVLTSRISHARGYQRASVSPLISRAMELQRDRQRGPTERGMFRMPVAIRPIRLSAGKTRRHRRSFLFPRRFESPQTKGDKREKEGSFHSHEALGVV